MDNLDFFKRVVADTCNSKMSMVVLTTKTQLTLQKNGFNKKNYSGHAEHFLHYV